MMFLNSWRWRTSVCTLVGDLRQRHAITVMSSRNFDLGIGGCVGKQVAAAVDLAQVGTPGLRVHRHHHVAATAPVPDNPPHLP